MALKGSLRDMSLSDLVQLACKGRGQAYLLVQSQDRRAGLFFGDGQIVHATLDSKEGEEVVYEILAWEEGEFALQQDVSPPKRTVNTPWSALLLEGLRRIDEQSASEEVDLNEWGIRPESEFVPGLEIEFGKKETDKMAKLNDLVKEMASEVPGFIAAGVAGMDGLPIAEHSVNPDFNMEAAAAQFALVMKLVQKSVSQLGKDEIEDNLVTTDNAYLLTRLLGDGSYFLSIAVDKGAASLGNVRLMTRQFADDLWAAIPKRGK
ncbi:MAG: DUF4388 domain-containing protein [Chloroflexota bacterium]|nr:DUF4388 domain-containing protein [Chloroflexota bacterium]